MYASPVELAAVVFSGILAGLAYRCRGIDDSALAEYRQLSDDLHSARETQRGLMPDMPSDIPGIELEAFCRPSSMVGGDFYDVFRVDEKHLGIAVGDVTGHGLPAALLMSLAFGVIRAEAARTLSPARLLERANSILCRSMPHNRFVAVAYAVLDTETKRVMVANAGQIAPYVSRNSTGRVEAVDVYGLPMGICEDADYGETEVLLGEGDRLLFTSDGIVEAVNPDREMYGFARLEADLGLIGGRSCRRILGDMLDRVMDFASGAPAADDMTMLVLGVN